MLHENAGATNWNPHSLPWLRLKAHGKNFLFTMHLKAEFQHHCPDRGHPETRMIYKHKEPPYLNWTFLLCVWYFTSQWYSRWDMFWKCHSQWVWITFLRQCIIPPAWGFELFQATGHMLSPLCRAAATKMGLLQGTAVNRALHRQWQWLVKPPPCWSFVTSAGVGV